MVIDGDVEAFDAGAGITLGAIAGGADAWPGEASELLDVEVEEIARMIPFVALDGRLGRFESGEPVQTVAAEDARDGGLGDLHPSQDLGIGTALATKREDVSFESGTGSARLAERNGRAVG